MAEGDNPRDIEFMRQAFYEALKAFEEGEFPVGAVIIRDGEVLGRGHNQIESSKNPTAHAEMIAITKAAQKIGNWRLNDTTIYVTLEPCIMCTGALILARVKEIVYGIEDEKFGGVVSLYRLPQDGRLNHQIAVRKGPLGEEVKRLMQSFFRKRRQDR